MGVAARIDLLEFYDLFINESTWRVFVNSLLGPIVPVLVRKAILNPRK